MALNRRELISAGVLGVGAWPGLASFGFANTAPTFAYTGPGVYLYPSWGEPRPYLVKPAADSRQGVDFCDPATNSVLWTQSLSFCRDFAGQLS